MRLFWEMLYLLWYGAVIFTDGLEIRHLSTDIGQGLERYVKLLKNCSRAMLINDDPHVEVRFRGDCSSDAVRIIHLGFYQPREIIVEFAIESPYVRLLSLKLNVQENPRLQGLLKKSTKLPTLRANQTLSKVLNLTECQARIRRRPRSAPLLGLCDDDPYLWRNCIDILDVYTESNESDEFVLAVRLADNFEVNIAVGLSPKAVLPEPSFNSQLRIEVVPRLLSAVLRQVLSTDDSSSFFRVISLPSSCTFLRALTRTKVAQFTQEAIDKLAIAFYCRKPTDETMVQLELVTMFGQTSDPFFVTISIPVDIDLSYNGVVLAGTTSTVRLTVTSSRDAEIRVVRGLQRGILLANGSPIDSFGTNMSLDYSVQGVGTHLARTVTTDNLVLAFGSFHFIVPVLLVPYEELQLQLNPVRVVPGSGVVLSPKHLNLARSHTGSFNLTLLDPPAGGRLLKYGEVVNNISSSDLLDLQISFRAFRNASTSETIVFSYTTPGSGQQHTTRLLVEYTGQKEDLVAPQQFECSLQVVVHPRNIRVPLGKSNLHFVDAREGGVDAGFAANCAREVMYEVKTMDSAVSGYLGNEKGHQISSFSQGDINQGSVFYFPPNVFHRVGGQKAIFEFRVYDAMGNTGPTNNLQVYLEALKISKTVSKQIVCRQPKVVLGSELLSLGYNSSSTVLGVTVLPKSGRLVRTRNGVDNDFVIGDSFSQGELIAGCISYQSGFAPTSDTFELLAVNPKDHTLRRRKVKRSRLKRRKFKRNGMQYFKIVVKLIVDDQMTGTEGRREHSLELVVDEGRKNSIVQTGSNFTLASIPRHGQVFIAVEKDDTVQITYVHSGKEVGLTENKDQFVLEYSQGLAKVHVRIIPVDNAAPIIKAAHFYQVMEAASVNLDIEVFDIDSKAFWCHIIEAPSYGRLTLNNDNVVNQIDNNNVDQIVYRQIVHRFVEPTEDHFSLSCSDGINVSPPKKIQISITPQNDETPSLKVINVTVLEGREAPVKIEAVDGDVPRDNLSFRINHLPTHGIVGLLQPNGRVEAMVSFFENALTLLMYKHDDSENLRDSFEVTVSDGIHSSRQRIAVKVLAVDDEAPTVLANRGLQVKIGDASVITSEHLKIVDADSDPTSVRVNIVKQPRYGSIWRNANDAELNQTIISSFSWQDLEFSRISYIHTSVLCCTNDSFEFALNDGFNEGPPHVFNVTVFRPVTIAIENNNRTFETTLINCSQRLPELSSIADIDWIEMSQTQKPVNGKLDIIDLGQRQAAFEYRIKPMLAKDVTNDTFHVLLQRAGRQIENVTMSIHWCWLTVFVPSDVSAGETLELQFHRSGGASTHIEGMLETSVGEFAFSIAPTMLTKTVSLHVPESLSGRRFLIHLSAVRGCLLHDNCSTVKVFSVIVLSTEKVIHFENDELSIQEPDKPFVKERFFVRVVRRPSSERVDIKFRFYTIVGTARSNEDFVPVDQGSKVSCSVKLASIDKKEPDGFWMDSEQYLVDDGSLCGGRAGSKPFSTKLSLDESSAGAQPRITFSLALTLPHHDGALPLWSTHSITPGDYQRPLFATKHVCSNIAPGNTSDFLSALDLRSCTWNYKRYFSLGELLACGGRLDHSDGENDDEDGHTAASTVTISLPMHVMYLVHGRSGRWQHVSVSNVLHIAFVYNNWAVGESGLYKRRDMHTSEISGSADVDSVSVDSNRNLVVTFRTTIKFHGRLVVDKEKVRWNESRLTLSPRRGVQAAFLLRLEKQLSETEALWTLGSLASLPQYTGNYSLAFFPCVGATPGTCRVQPQSPPLQFTLPVEVETPQDMEQQSYSMDSVMELTSADRWLSMETATNQTNQYSNLSSVFHQGETVLGVVRTFLVGSSPERSPLVARIRQCFLCHNITRTTTPHLSVKPNQQPLHCPYKIIDWESSNDSSVMSAPEMSFHGRLASQHRRTFSAELLQRLDSLGADGFTFDIDSLFAWEPVDDKHPWHVHCIFSVLEQSAGTPGRFRRNSAFEHWPKEIVLQKSLELLLAKTNSSASSVTKAQQALLATACANIVGVFFCGALVVLLFFAVFRLRKENSVVSTYRTVPVANEVISQSGQQETLL
ncbi:extracellular matrix protein 3-like isoform X2 [Varroa destructor]|uniref:Uncharacterized protein n=1 Tax=Varroa destructor TaxID=109461 RepID=A0A7M7J7K2_VARDE|nr:extracellular matrix protein 3-like isoform X2 [Varroa destructor]